MIILYVIIRIILIVIIVGAMGAFAINSMLNPISDKEREEIRKEGCMGTSCDMKNLVLLIHDKINEERKQYVLYFNKCIKKKCEENNWVFFDI